MTYAFDFYEALDRNIMRMCVYGHQPMSEVMQMTFSELMKKADLAEELYSRHKGMSM